MYSTPTLEAAVAEVTKLRADRVSVKPELPVLDEAHRTLFRRMGAIPPAKAAGLTYCLEPGEKALLADYLFGEAQDSEKETLSSVLLEEMDPDGADQIYRQCLAHCDDKNYRPLFKMLNGHHAFRDIISKHYGVDTDIIMSGLLDGSAPGYFNSIAEKRTGSGQGGYMGALTELGITEGSTLYNRCAELYILVCPAAEYKKIGAEKLLKLAEGWDDTLRQRLLENMLRELDAFQLRTFVSLLDIFISMTGYVGSPDFKRVLVNVNEINKKKYSLWISQYLVMKTLEDEERSKFWLEYIERCTVSIHRPSGSLLLDFGKFSVIELKSGEAVYFYDEDYYRNVVLDGINMASSEKELDDWLKNKTEWASQGDNSMHWRKAHFGNWQMDVRNYIAKYSK